MSEDPRSQKDMFGLMKAALEDLLSHGPVVRVVFIDHPLLDVPRGVRPKARGTTTFEYGLNLPVPIDDLEITDAGIRATLSFSRCPHPTFVPWAAVVGILLPFQEEPVPSPVRKPGNRPKLSLVP
jgi:hypothetical protein